jgi:glutamyl/glutaminyl-tRNA synthetase
MREIGLEPSQVIVQSRLHQRHRELFDQAVREQQVYPCACTRKELREALAQLASAPHRSPPIYNGHCRNLDPQEVIRQGEALPGIAWRFKSADASGEGDFIVARTEKRPENGTSTFVPGYNWACAADDYDGRFALIVRAWDLSDVVEQQRSIQAWIARHEKSEWQPAAVYHCALVTNKDGHRLEKRTHGVTFPEVFRMGISPRRLQEIFARSVDRNSFQAGDFSDGKIWGESKKTMTLSELELNLNHA